MNQNKEKDKNRFQPIHFLKISVIVCYNVTEHLWEGGQNIAEGLLESEVPERPLSVDRANSRPPESRRPALCVPDGQKLQFLKESLRVLWIPLLQEKRNEGTLLRDPLQQFDRAIDIRHLGFEDFQVITLIIWSSLKDSILEVNWIKSNRETMLSPE